VASFTPTPDANRRDRQNNFQEMMRTCILDALQLKNEVEGVDLTHGDIRSLSSTLFFAWTRV
jgi:hypothetical protein